MRPRSWESLSLKRPNVLTLIPSFSEQPNDIHSTVTKHLPRVSPPPPIHTVLDLGDTAGSKPDKVSFLVELLCNGEVGIKLIYNIILYVIRIMKKNEAEERLVRGYFRDIREGFPEEVILEQRPEEEEEGS